MNLLEIFIIYLSAGAPFGVHFFFQNRYRSVPSIILLKSFLTVFVWIPYALRLLNAYITENIFTALAFARVDGLVSTKRKKLDQAQKRLLRILTLAGTDISLFEIREVLERYAGLTIARQNFPEDAEPELLKSVNHQNLRIGGKCFQRRNRFRLEKHQILASKDFLNLLRSVSQKEKKKLRPAALYFVKLLDDTETFRAVEKLFDATQQTKKGFAVKSREIEVWKSTEHKQPPARQISLPISSSVTMRELHKKD
jgi:hypothetical protein